MGHILTDPVKLDRAVTDLEKTYSFPIQPDADSIEIITHSSLFRDIQAQCNRGGIYQRPHAAQFLEIGCNLIYQRDNHN